jgi:hypothetical protein
MFDHLLPFVAHEALHRAVDAWRAAMARADAQAYLLATYQLLEQVRIGQLLKDPATQRKSAGEVATVLQDVRSHRPDYWELQKRHPENFAALQDLAAEYDYQLRSFSEGTIKNVEFQILTMKLRHAIEALGVTVPFTSQA